MEMELAPEVLLAASNGRGHSSSDPVATTPSPHVQCGEAMCLASTACPILQSEACRCAGRQKVLPQGERREFMEERRESVKEHCGGHARRPPVLAHSLAFKRWAKGRCYRCLARDH
jgi:hypothetical protein